MNKVKYLPYICYLALTLFLQFFYKNEIGGDSYSYFNVSDVITESLQFRNKVFLPGLLLNNGGFPDFELTQPLVYPIALSLINILVYDSQLSSLILNITIGLFSLLLLNKILRRYYPEKLVLSILLLISINPIFIKYHISGLTEPLVLFFLLTIIYLIVNNYNKIFIITLLCVVYAARPSLVAYYPGLFFLLFYNRSWGKKYYLIILLVIFAFYKFLEYFFGSNEENNYLNSIIYSINGIENLQSNADTLSFLSDNFFKYISRYFNNLILYIANLIHPSLLFMGLPPLIYSIIKKDKYENIAKQFILIYLFCVFTISISWHVSRYLFYFLPAFIAINYLILNLYLNRFKKYCILVLTILIGYFYSFFHTSPLITIEAYNVKSQELKKIITTIKEPKCAIISSDANSLAHFSKFKYINYDNNFQEYDQLFKKICVGYIILNKNQSYNQSLMNLISTNFIYSHSSENYSIYSSL